MQGIGNITQLTEGDGQVQFTIDLRPIIERRIKEVEEKLAEAEKSIAALKVDIQKGAEANEAILKRLQAIEAKQSPAKKKLELPTEHKHPELRAEALKQIKSLWDAKFYFMVLDTETSDLKGEIIQVAALRMDGQPIRQDFIKPQGIISVEAEKVHGISMEMVKDAPSFREVWEKRGLRNLLETPDHVVIYGKYEIDRFRQAMLQHGIPYDESKIHWFDAMPLVANALGIYWFEGKYDKPGSYKFEKLEEVAELLGVQVEEKAHSSMGDCKRLLGVLKVLKGWE